MEKRTLTRCQKIVLYGPESTGKTTLAKALANHYNTLWVPEFARIICRKNGKINAPNATSMTYSSLQENKQAETEAVKNAHRFLFCDTNVLVTKVWSETHFDGYCAPALLRMAEQVQDVHYFLTNIDVLGRPTIYATDLTNETRCFTIFKSSWSIKGFRTRFSWETIALECSKL